MLEKAYINQIASEQLVGGVVQPSGKFALCRTVEYNMIIGSILSTVPIFPVKMLVHGTCYLHHKY